MHDHPAQPFPRQPLSRSMNFVSTQVHLVEAHLTMPDCWLRSAIYIRGRTRSDYARHARGLLVNSLRNESVTTLSCHPFPSFLLFPVPGFPRLFYIRGTARFSPLLTSPLLLTVPRNPLAVARSSVPESSSYIPHEFSTSFRLSLSLFLFL